MSTAAKTSRSSRTEGPSELPALLATKKRKRLSYTPGAPVRARSQIAFRGLPFDVLDKILTSMVTSRSVLSIVKLSMVCRSLRQGVNENLNVWYKLYLIWRGPIHPLDRTITTPRGVVRLRPTVPTTVPNFRVKTPSQTLLMTADKPPTDDMTEEEKRQALHVYRKIVALQVAPCCGMCGTTRHSTKPFWCLGMRVCRHCTQANLVSSLVLYERYWITFGQPVQGFRNFVDAVCANVFYFSSRLTPNQRLDFSCDRLDFPGGIQSMWFFWMPHLAGILDMGRLEREGQEKHRMAAVVRAHARRALVLRAMRGTKCFKTPTLLPTDVFAGKKRDLRCTEFRLRKTELLDKNDMYNDHRMRAQLAPGLFTRLSQSEDRVVPYLFN